MAKQEQLAQFLEETRLAKPGIPREKPVRRAIPEVSSPLPQRRIPQIPVEPTRTPAQPVPVRR